MAENIFNLKNRLLIKHMNFHLTLSFIIAYQIVDLAKLSFGNLDNENWNKKF